MPWINPRRIFHLNDSPDRSNHAQMPTPYVMEDRVRVYYSCRRNNKSFPCYFDLAEDLTTVLGHREGIVDPSPAGRFDSDGFMPSCVIKKGDELWMYYVGWLALAGEAKYHTAIGLAASRDGEFWTRKFDAPVMDRTREEPGIHTTPYVYMTNNGLKMLYASGSVWKDGDCCYFMYHASSDDGVTWLEASRRKLNKSKDAVSCRPTLQLGNNSLGWVCHCSRTFKTDYIILPEPPPRSNWDSDMQCYPYVFEFGGKMLMLYNGNGYGQTGVGLAEYEE